METEETIGHDKKNLNKVKATKAAHEWLLRLFKIHGPLLLYQSGGCCEGSAPLCMTQKEFRIGDNDVLLGMVDETPYYIKASQFEVWKHTDLTLDVIEGSGNAFSLESPEGVSFHITSKVCDI